MDKDGNLKILIVEDEPETAKLLGLLLNHKVSARSDTAFDCKSAREKLSESTFDLVTLDYQLPDGDGLSLLQEILSMREPPPVVMVTGHGDERTAVEAFKLGASGYVVKDARLNVMLVEEVKAALVKRELRKAELALIDKEEMLSHLYESAAEGIMVGGPDGRFQYINPAGAAIYGFDSPEELIGTPVADRYADPVERDKLISILMEQGTVKDFRLKLKRKDGTVFTNEINAVLFKDEDGNIVRTTAYTSYRVQQEEAARAVRRSEEKYRQMFDNMSSGVVTYEAVDNGEDFIITDCNKAAEKVIDRKSTVGKTVRQVFSSVEESPVFKVLREVWRSGELVRFPQAGGFDQYVNRWLEGYVYKLPAGEIVAVFDDITERVERDRVLRENQEMLSQIYDLAAEGIVVTGADHRIAFANTQALKLLGYEDSKELKGTLAADLYVKPETRDQMLPVLMESGSVKDLNVEVKRRDGGSFWARFNVSVQIDENGEFCRGITIFADITERKQASEALKESEARLREIYDFAAEGIAVVGADGIHQYVNQRMAELFGFAGVEEMIGTPVLDRYANPEDRDKLIKALHEEGSVRGYELELKRKDGTSIQVMGNMSLLFDEDGNPSRSIGFFTDITEKKAAEVKLARNEVMLYELYNSAVEGIAIADAAGLLIYVNQRLVEMGGFGSPEEMIGTCVADRYVNPEDRTKLLEILYEKSFIQGYELELKRKDGSHAWVSGNMSLIIDEDGKPSRSIAFFTDVTERKRVEEELEKNKAMLRSIYESSIEGILITNAEGKYEFANTKAAQLFGFDRAEEMIGVSGGDWYRYPEDRQEIVGILLSEGSIKDYEVEYRRKDGTYFWARISGAVERDITGNVKSTTGFMVDISEEKRAEADLRKSEASLRGIYESAIEGIGVAGADGKFVLVNPRLARMFGFDSVDEMIGTSAIERYADSERRETLMSLLCEKGFVEGFEAEGSRKDGGVFWTRTNVVLERDEDGRPFRTVGFIMDITERKKAEEELLCANRELEAFAHTVSHNLKGPLSSVGMAVELLRLELDDRANEEVRGLLENIENNTAKGHERIDSLLWLARSGQKPVEVHSIDVRELVDEILEEVNAEGVGLSIDDDLGSLLASKEQLHQVFSNLITNAVQHNTEEKPEIRVAYEGLSGEGVHKYLVCDNGPGIKEDELENIFTPFYKGKNTGETGLGLSIAQNIASVYDGNIRVYNDNGACFEVTLKDYDAS
ncbi:MAG: PAS domain S-box protein [Actinobacteria bacterium]|nr:PAS domain S-box protein [Actinomycetota bacterium]